MVLPQSGSVLVSLSYFVTKDHTDAWGLGHNLCPWGCLKDMLPLGLCWYEWPLLSPRAAAKGHVWIRDPSAAESRVMPMSLVTTDYYYGDGHGLVSHLRPCWCSKVMLCQVPYWSEWPVLPQQSWWCLGPTAAKDHACAHGPAAAGVCDNVHGPC